MGYLAKTGFQSFLLVGHGPQNGATHFKSEAMAWNVGGVHLDFNFGERIWRSGQQRANLKVHYEIGPLGATTLDTLTQFEI